MNYAIILAGGAGSRFWPLSRSVLPKQFLRLVGRDTLFEATLRRVTGIVGRRNVFIAANRACLREIKRQLSAFGVPQENIILEPAPKNTLPAILLCARMISLKDDQANVLVLPADHYIGGLALFASACAKGLKISADGFICLLGIRPKSPNPGYGYIKTGENIGRDGFVVRSFIEKPAVKAAEKLLKQGDCLWNSGIFCFKAGIILEEARKLVPGAWRQIIRIRQIKDAQKVWPAISPVSLDYGILERSKNIACVKAKFSWCDLGAWDALYGLMPADRANNVILSDCVRLKSCDNFVYSHDKRRTIAIIGMKDTIVVDTPDALLICKKENAQDVKGLVELLKINRRSCV